MYFNEDKCTLLTSSVLYHIEPVSILGGKLAMKGRIYPVCLRDLILVAQRLRPLIQLQCISQVTSCPAVIAWGSGTQSRLSNYWVCALKPLYLSTSMTECVFLCLCNRSARANVSEGHQLCFKHLFLIEAAMDPISSIPVVFRKRD